MSGRYTVSRLSPHQSIWAKNCFDKILAYLWNRKWIGLNLKSRVRLSSAQMAKTILSPIKKVKVGDKSYQYQASWKQKTSRFKRVIVFWKSLKVEWFKMKGNKENLLTNSERLWILR